MWTLALTHHPHLPGTVAMSTPSITQEPLEASGEDNGAASTQQHSQAKLKEGRGGDPSEQGFISSNPLSFSTFSFLPSTGPPGAATYASAATRPTPPRPHAIRPAHPAPHATRPAPPRLTPPRSRHCSTSTCRSSTIKESPRQYDHLTAITPLYEDSHHASV
ncbi:hypothetical protein Hamer_G011457 [Homarus americanus]|uniref:Uncharacterized protein n=1 Tax=Homarus americanus TaxID=6706 RepID=A0A8J5MP97_HOMAM|nr:hypothetical protein Hamer_G011457 [Homarus americanus]